MSTIKIAELLPPAVWRLVHSIGVISAEMQTPAYIVGGFVRDLLLQRASNDIDIVFEGDAITVAEAVAQQMGGKVYIHNKFGTATWQPVAETWKSLQVEPPKIELGGIDFVTARREQYTHSGALPDVTPSNIDDDLRRRDFTINTLGICINGGAVGELYDVLGGQADLEAGIIRVLFDGSFVDDPTRIFRAGRYANRLKYVLAPETNQQLLSAIPNIDNLSNARIWHEIEHMLSEPERVSMLQWLHDVGALAQITAGFVWLPDWAELLEKGEVLAEQTLWQDAERHAVYLLVWLAKHPVEAQQAIRDRLSLTNSVIKNLEAVNAMVAGLAAVSAESPPSQFDQIIHPFGQLPNALLAAYILTDSSAITRYRTTWQPLKPLLNGNDLRQLGFKPGPQFKTILAQLRAQQIDGTLSDRIDAERWVTSLL